MTAVAVLRDDLLEQGLSVAGDEDIPTLDAARGLLLGGLHAELARQACRELAYPFACKLRRRRPIPRELVRQAFLWHAQRTADLLLHWGELGSWRSPLWELTTLVRWDRFVAHIWYPAWPRMAARWDTKHRDSKAMPRDVQFRSIGMWRRSRERDGQREYLGDEPPSAPGWEMHDPHPFGWRPQRRFDGSAA